MLNVFTSVLVFLRAIKVLEFSLESNVSSTRDIRPEEDDLLELIIHQGVLLDESAIFV